jgi:hypothetical protein
MKFTSSADLEKIVQGFAQPDSAQILVRELDLHPVPLVSRALYLRLLGNSNPQIVQIALAGLREKATTTPNFDINGLELTLIEFIATANSAHALPAISLLCELCVRDPANLAIASRTESLHRVMPALSHFAYTPLLGTDAGAQLADVNAELSWWIDRGLVEYLSVYDRSVGAAFEQVVLDGFPSVIIIDGVPTTPPHLFGELARTERGHAAVTAELPSVFALCDSPSIAERRAAFFALGHFASAPRSAPFVREIVRRMVAATQETRSYVLRGTLLAALSLCSVTPEFVSSLREHGFTLFTFRDRSYAVPVDPRGLLIPFRDPDVRIPIGDPPPSQIARLAAQLLTPIHRNAAMKELYAASKERPTELATTENARYCRVLMAENCYQAESRQFLLTLFHNAAIVGPDPTVIDPAKEAEVRARVAETLVMAGNPVGPGLYVFSTVPVPKMSVAEVKAKRKGVKAPEAYLSDEEFALVFGRMRDDFYSLPEGERDRLIAGVFG